ncbi:MAG: ferrous iron transport protein B [Clostridia bacterium]|nr:ferrous iron transport protein B [Clostridia bacterium]
MAIKIALAGNPNSGKTTLFNALTGSNQFVGNWPGVTVEKKEGKLKGHDGVTLVDLPGIYSLSPYTLEEVVSRNFLLDEQPSAIINIIDGSNLERNLYLTTQLVELGIPVVAAINMMDVVRKAGDKIDKNKLSKSLGCPVMEISALKGEGIKELAAVAVDTAKAGKRMIPQHSFVGSVEHAIAHIEEEALHSMPEERQRWYAIKLFERDAKVQEKLNLSADKKAHIEKDIAACEQELDDDSESIITNERYDYIAGVVKSCYVKKNRGQLSTSDKIDRVITNRWLGLPIFAVVMWIVYYVSVTTVGTLFTDWANDGVFGDGWHLFMIGASEYEEACEEYAEPALKIGAFEEAAEEAEIEPDSEEAADLVATAIAYDDNGEVEETFEVTQEEYLELAELEEPDPANYGVWVPGIPVLVEAGLEAVNCADWLSGLILDGIVGGVGAVLGFVPQMLVLFLFLAFLEACGYMARIAFIMDRIFRRFGLSGKSFIPMLIGTGCGIPGIMASRTIESDRDRKMTIMTTTFIPCGAKLPIIALIAGALFNNAAWVATSAYFVGIAAIVISGIILKKTKPFAGDPAPFVMELPAYHMPTIGAVLRSMWERGWSFIKKAGTIILLSSVLLWFLQGFGFTEEGFGMCDLNESLLANIGNAIAWIFTPLGWGNWQSAVATITGLIAKENVVATYGTLLGGMEEVAENGWEIWEVMRSMYTPLTAYSFLVFNLLCAPCFAAMGAIKREMNNGKWTAFAIAYQCVFAYAIALMINQFGSLFTGGGFGIGTVAALVVLVVMIWLLVRKTPKENL